MGAVGQRVRMHNGLKIHRTTAATFLRRYAGLSADSSTTGFAVGSGALPLDGIVRNTKPVPWRSKRPQQTRPAAASDAVHLSTRWSTGVR